MGAATMDEGCEDGAVWINCLYGIIKCKIVVLCAELFIVVMVYGVLFLDWNTENSDTPENPPFHSVRML